MGEGAQSGIELSYEKGIISKNVYGINGTGRPAGDMCSPDAEWVDFNTVGHRSASMDYHYEMSVKLSRLGITKEDIEQGGIGVMLVLTGGQSGVDSLPYDLSMNDHAGDSESGSQDDDGSLEKFDKDHVTTAFARIGKNAPALTNTSTVSSATITQGQSVTVNCSSTGGTGTKQYAVYYKLSTKTDWTKAQDYSTTTAVTVKPTEVGKYDIRVDAKDGSGKVVSKTLNVTVNAPALANTSTVSATSITKGQSVTVTCSATGGTGTRTYGVWYKKSTASSWTKAQDYSTNASVVVTPKYSGEYTISVRVKDGSGKTVRKEFTVNVTVLQTLKNKSSLSAGTIQYGESVTVQGAAEGGAGNLQYAIYAKQEGQNSWTLLRDYSSIPSFVFKPENTGNYTVRVKIRDDEGAVVRKDLLLTVTGEKLVNTSKQRRLWYQMVHHLLPALRRYGMDEAERIHDHFGS